MKTDLSEHIATKTTKDNRSRIFILATLIMGIILGVKVYSENLNLKCNGYTELCDRRLNEVVFPMTHNSMSVANGNWFGPSNEHSITDQLNSGVRGLMVDTHYFDAITSIASYFPEATEEEIALMQKFADSIDAKTMTGTYTCHVMCQLGYKPFNDLLIEIKNFLDTNPNEIVIITIEDKINVDDTVKAFNDSEIDKYVYEHTQNEWPTLRELINLDKRLIVFSEQNYPPPNWYPNTWSFVEDTPYSFQSPNDMNCESFRGKEGSDFFLINHWITRTVPSREDAQYVNSYEFLKKRVDDCIVSRGRLPNFISVNFSERGDLFKVVNELNELSD